MRRRRSNAQLPDRWRQVASQRLRQWPLLDDDERARLEQLAVRVLDKRWEAAHGFAIDDAMRVTVAAHAALLHLGHDDEPFLNVTAIVMHPTSMMLRGERPGPSPGVMTDAPLAAHGHTTSRGPVFIAWDTVQRELRMPQRATNVILHEFAHKIDALNGMFNGTPRLADEDQLREWVEVCSAELKALRRGDTAGVLRPYAATNPSEFFAVATEAFFEQPGALKASRTQLYDVLSRFYRQDPARREPDDPPAQTTDTGFGGAITQGMAQGG